MRRIPGGAAPGPTGTVRAYQYRPDFRYLSTIGRGTYLVTVGRFVSFAEDQAVRHAYTMAKAARPARAAREPRRGGENGSGTAVITRTRTQTKKPSMYRVLLLNDDYTPMEFVVTVLRKYFNKGSEEATTIMLHVHQHGVGECGVFTYE